MSDTAQTLSIVLFTAFAVYFFLAIYILNLNIKSAQNLSFFGVCLALCVWSFGSAMFVIAPNQMVAFVWARVTAFGWSAVYSLMLHFLLILTGRSKLLGKWWFYPLLYAPAVINIFVFSLLNSTAQIEHVITQVSFGWFNASPLGVWDVLFNIYYIGYILAGLVMVLLWKRSSKDKMIQSKSNLIIISFVTALILGTLTDQILPHILGLVLPQMAILEIMFPIIVFYHLVKKYGLMAPVHADNKQTILNKKSRTKLYSYLSVCYLFYGLFHFFYKYIITGSGMLNDVLDSVVLLFCGFCIFFAGRIKKELLRNTIILTIMLLSIPLTAILLTEYGATTSWAFPLILIMVSLVFNRRILLISLSSMSILTHILYYFMSVGTPYGITPFDLVFRCILYVLICLIGVYINRIYVSKLKENAAQIELQKLISGISYDFARIDKTNLEETINRMLEKIGSYFGADRTYVFLVDSSSNSIQLCYEWCGPGITPELGLVEPVPVNGFDNLFERMSDHHTVYSEDVLKQSTLYQSYLAGSKILLNKDIISLLSTPIESTDKQHGFLGMATYKTPLKLTDIHLEILETFSNLIADKLVMAKADKDMEYLAYYDQLTGLPNRTLFKDRLNQAIYLAERTGKYLGIIFLDLDSFKAVNDTLGHSGGDALLQDVAEKLRSNLRKSDTVARFGGDEFLLLINNITECSMIKNIASNIMKQFTSPFKLSGQEYYVTACAGIAVYPIDGEDCDTLIKNADIAMYRAKDCGVNQYALCTPEMKEEVLKNMLLTNSLYRALDRGELSIEYQPQIRLDTGRICGTEALLRWTHPKLGKISPEVFIPLAEKNGLINSIGEWVLKTACAQNKKWHESGCDRCRIAVNVSTVQLRSPRLVETIKAVLYETGLEAEHLELEVTESAAISESHALNEIIRQLKVLGISISIDDFGTEYSSLKHLKELPVDRIKIDMQFIQGLMENEKDQAITLTIINLAKNLGLKVIAEGVETEEQMKFLLKNRCDEIQGYYYYKPMPPDELEYIVREAQDRFSS